MQATEDVHSQNGLHVYLMGAELGSIYYYFGGLDYWTHIYFKTCFYLYAVHMDAADYIIVCTCTVLLLQCYFLH